MVRRGSRRSRRCNCAVPGRPLRAGDWHVEATIAVSVATGMVPSRCRRRRGRWCGSTCRRPAPSDDNNKPPKQGQRADSGRSGSERARDRRATSPDPAWAGCLFRFGEHCLFETPNASLKRRVQQMKSSTVSLAAVLSRSLTSYTTHHTPTTSIV
jgi:hypothetical protein